MHEIVDFEVGFGLSAERASTRVVKFGDGRRLGGFHWLDRVIQPYD